MNRINKDEFKNAMRAAKVEEEINEILKDIDDPIKEDLIEDPEDLPVENPEETAKSVEKQQKPYQIGKNRHQTAQKRQKQHRWQRNKSPGRNRDQSPELGNCPARSFRRQRVKRLLKKI